MRVYGCSEDVRFVFTDCHKILLDGIPNPPGVTTEIIRQWQREVNKIEIRVHAEAVAAGGAANAGFETSWARVLRTQRLIAEKEREYEEALEQWKKGIRMLACNEDSRFIHLDCNKILIAGTPNPPEVTPEVLEQWKRELNDLELRWHAGAGAAGAGAAGAGAPRKSRRNRKTRRRRYQ
jgi:hypothetical protein